MSYFGRNGMGMKGRESSVSGGSASRWRGSDVRKGLRAGIPILVEEGSDTSRNSRVWAEKPRDR